MSRPLKVQIVQRARALIADEHHWCRKLRARCASPIGSSTEVPDLKAPIHLLWVSVCHRSWAAWTRGKCAR